MKSERPYTECKARDLVKGDKVTFGDHTGFWRVWGIEVLEYMDVDGHRIGTVELELSQHGPWYKLWMPMRNIFRRADSSTRVWYRKDIQGVNRDESST